MQVQRGGEMVISLAKRDLITIEDLSNQEIEAEIGRASCRERVLRNV
jgi:hypothetical protein